MGTHGFTIFCDDIRDEIGAKHSLIGTYVNALFHQLNYPVTFAKLGIYTRLHILPNEMPKQVEIVVESFNTKNILFRQMHDMSHIDVDDLLKQAGPYLDEQEERYVAFGLNIILSPLVCTGNDRIRVRAHLDGKPVKLGALDIVKDERPTPTQPAPTQ